MNIASTPAVSFKGIYLCKDGLNTRELKNAREIVSEMRTEDRDLLDLFNQGGIDMVIMKNDRSGLKTAFISSDRNEIFKVNGKDKVSCTNNTYYGRFDNFLQVPCYISRLRNFAGNIISDDCTTTKTMTETKAQLMPLLDSCTTEYYA